MEGLALDGR